MSCRSDCEAAGGSSFTPTCPSSRLSAPCEGASRSPRGLDAATHEAGPTCPVGDLAQYRVAAPAPFPDLSGESSGRTPFTRRAPQSGSTLAARQDPAQISECPNSRCCLSPPGVARATCCSLTRRSLSRCRSSRRAALDADVLPLTKARLARGNRGCRRQVKPDGHGEPGTSPLNV